MKEKQIWKDIPGYENHYQVSNFGNIKSLAREYLRYGSKVERTEEKSIKPGIGRSGYYCCVLYKNGQRKTMQIHQLVAICFLNHTPNKGVISINHIDHNKLNNCLDNLEIVTVRQNSNHRKKTGASKYPGVDYSKSNKKWRARILIGSERKFLGYFENQFEAHLSYQNELQNKRK